MGDMAEGILDGLFCQGCGEVIDGEEIGFPRSCSACQGYTRPRPSPERIAIVKDLMIANGYEITMEREINYGWQIKTKSGASVNVFYTGTIAVQGIPDDKLKKLLIK